MKYYGIFKLIKESIIDKKAEEKIKEEFIKSREDAGSSWYTVTKETLSEQLEELAKNRAYEEKLWLKAQKKLQENKL